MSCGFIFGRVSWIAKPPVDSATVFERMHQQVKNPISACTWLQTEFSMGLISCTLNLDRILQQSSALPGLRHLQTPFLPAKRLPELINTLTLFSQDYSIPRYQICVRRLAFFRPRNTPDGAAKMIHCTYKGDSPLILITVDRGQKDNWLQRQTYGEGTSGRHYLQSEIEGRVSSENKLDYQQMGCKTCSSFRLGFVFIIAGRTEVKWIIKERSHGL